MKTDKIDFIRTKLLKWYEKNKKDLPWRKTEDLFKVLISEIFLQKTNTSSVDNIYEPFFSKYHNFNDLYKADPEELKSDIEELGLVNRRVKTLKSLGKLVMGEYNGEIPPDSDTLKEIYGIGDYISKAFRCFGLNKREIFLDTNIKRILQRIWESRKQKNLKNRLDQLMPAKHFQEFYYALLDFGSKICSQNRPECNICPFSPICDYYQKRTD